MDAPSDSMMMMMMDSPPPQDTGMPDMGMMMMPDTGAD
jgi:hypothetical protein